MSDRLNILPEENPSSENWYSGGLRFKCTGCGQCCTGAPGYVWVNDAEIEAMAAHLKISVEQFRQKYIRQVGLRESLLEHSKTYDCVFLKDNKCQIYTVRPTQCRTFPWWQHNLQSEAQWNEAAKYCEGINHPEAPLVAAETICQQLSKNHKPEIKDTEGK